MSQKKPPLVEVEWMDAVSTYEVYTFARAPEECPLVRRFTCGYLVHKDREKIIVVGTYDPPTNQYDEDRGQDFVTIPRAWVKGIVTFEPTTTKESEE